MSTPAETAVRDALRTILEQARMVAEAGGPEDRLGLRNRAVEISAMAETMLWTVDPDASDWLTGLYERVAHLPEDTPA
jgi:hypothetical protein